MLVRILAAAVILTSLLVGCDSPINPIGPIIQLGIYWLDGEAHKYYNTDHLIIRKATLDTLKELDIPVIRETEYDDYYYILAGDDDRFKIKIRSVRAKITKLSIRVNTFGDKPFAELIYRHLDKQQGVEQFTSLPELNTAMEHRRRR